MLSDSRSAYLSLKEHYMKSINGSDDVTADEPLSGSETDEELRAEIFQDVERCMPENAYFREPSTQSMLLEILFVYCKLNHDISYRQGMHEVLAPILWVVSCDAIDPKDSKHGPELDDLMLTSLDATYIEHDAFTLFGIIMQTVKTFYEVGNSNEPATTGLLQNSPIVERSKRIHENYLYHADPELAEHLAAIEILPQIFLIRWVRLLFGREFPFDDVLALWDILFAEDPTLDLVDLICVSMLLRIRWQLLEADYSAALTLLLRYPVPKAPHGPPTFVNDALYLRDNLLLDGGDHIIFKYSHKSPETTVTRKLPKKVKRTRTEDKEAAQKAVAPSLSPSRFLQEQGGIEHIIQEAAKGVYLRGEQWGVTKALRGAVQGLQSANAVPRSSPEKSRWSLDSGKVVSEGAPAALVAKIQALEERNKSLAKILETAMNEMWTQQNTGPQDVNEKGLDALSLAIVKVQFVQVYLENSSMPLTAELLDATNKEIFTPEKVLPSSQPEGRVSPPIVDEPISERTLSTRTKPKPQKSPRKPSPSPPSPRKPTTPPKSGHKMRPSLSQSPYSWMLGEEQGKSDFVTASPFSSHVAGRGRTGNLFGDNNKQQAKQVGNDDGDVFSNIGKRGERST
ncbi:MAG: hypothetical protein Q9217_003640 [Psora testacea]